MYQYNSISQSTFRTILEKHRNNYIIVDLRNKKVYNEYHIENAIHIEYNDFMAMDDYSELIKENKDIILYCSSGGSSIYASRKLQKFIDYRGLNIFAYSLEGGIQI